MPERLGIAHFVAQTDTLGASVLAILIVMSVGCWYLILAKAWADFAERRSAARYLAVFRTAGRTVAGAERGNAFHALALEAEAISAHVARHGATHLPDTGAGELISRSLRMRTQREVARRESGLAFLAATASSAPFIGLFGTVWGIYQALIGIGMSGQGTLERIAGPVGEALVMTGAGLAVAIPAALAYNYFARANRRLSGELHGFANELLLFAATGAARDPEHRQQARGET